MLRLMKKPGMALSPPLGPLASGFEHFMKFDLPDVRGSGTGRLRFNRAASRPRWQQCPAAMLRREIMHTACCINC